MPVIGPMSAGTALAGTATVWLGVLILAALGGYGSVHAWARWGGRLAGPPWLLRACRLLLGAPDPVPAATAAAAAEAAPVAEEEAAPIRRVVPVAAAAEAEAALLPEQPEIHDDGAASADGVDDAADGPVDEAEGDAVAPETARPRRSLTREEALAELGELLGADYAEAVALVESGLWGFENVDEWARTMRGREAPEGISAETWERATHTSGAAIAEAVAKGRERRKALAALESLWGVGPDEAEALYDAGYTDVARLRKVATDSLAKVPGIGMARAFQIRAAAHGLAPTP